MGLVEAQNLVDQAVVWMTWTFRVVITYITVSVLYAVLKSLWDDRYEGKGDWRK